MCWLNNTASVSAGSAFDLDKLAASIKLLISVKTCRFLSVALHSYCSYFSFSEWEVLCCFEDNVAKQNWKSHFWLCFTLIVIVQPFYLRESALIQQEVEYNPKALNAAVSSYVLVMEVSADSPVGWYFSISSTAFEHKIVLDNDEFPE